MHPGRQCSGFSLIEVVLAVAIAGGSIAVILGLLPALARQAEDSQEARHARSLAGAVRSALVGRGADGVGALAASIPALGGEAGSGRQFVVARRGTELRPLDSETGAEDDGYFLVTLRRFAASPLADEAAAAFLAVNVTVSWPHVRSPTGRNPPPDASVHRQSVSFNVSVRR